MRALLKYTLRKIRIKKDSRECEIIEFGSFEEQNL